MDLNVQCSEEENCSADKERNDNKQPEEIEQLKNDQTHGKLPQGIYL